MTATSSEQAVILVADDDPDILELVAIGLERSGYDVVRATDGEQALQLATELRPDLAVLDVTMPKLSGYDVTRMIREGAATRQMRVLLLTARVQEADVALGVAAGADDYVKKPFSPEALSARIEVLLDRR